jgi:uncharacterized protein (DUF924 family)
MHGQDLTPEDVLAFWFPEPAEPDPAAHLTLWTWRMRGGAHDAIIERFTALTKRGAEGGLDGWAATPSGRLALIIVLDQFSRSVWAGKPEAYAQDRKALDLCLEGLENGDFDGLANVWQKTMFKMPLEHCECADHLANLDRVVALATALADEAPANLKEFYRFGVRQPQLHRAVIAAFGRHPHRNAILGRVSTPEEAEYLFKGDFPHQSDLAKLVGG